MYLKKTRQKNGRIYLSIVDGYYDKQKGHSRTITIEKVGYLDELEKHYDDPISFFNKRVDELKILKSQRLAPISLEFSHDEVISSQYSYRKNFGYCVLSHIYHELGIDKFLVNKQRNRKMDFSSNNIMKLLVYSRILFPASKKKTFEQRHRYFEKDNFSLDDVYRCLSFFNTHSSSLQLWLNDKIKNIYSRDTSLVYYDVTNFYFETDNADDLRKKGVSKEHRPNPIVQMGLFMDNLGIPITYELFPGNTNDCLTFRPGLARIKKQYDLGKIIVVADKGMSTGDNVYYTLSGKNGYVFSLSIRGADKSFKDYVLDQKGYVFKGSDYKSKSRLYPRTILVSSTNGNKIKKVAHEKQVIFYSDKYAKKARAERDKAIQKALKIINSPCKYSKSSSIGAAHYIKDISFDKNTGEIISSGKILNLDVDKIQAEEALDGYYAIVTSEYELPDDKIIDIYRGLWKIEESFRVTKSDLEARPVFVSTEDHINAHFLTCFISLVITRIIELRLGNKYSITKIIESLSNAQCTHMKQNFYLFDYYDDILHDLGTQFNIDFSLRVRSLSDIKKIFADTKKVQNSL